MFSILTGAMIAGNHTMTAVLQPSLWLKYPQTQMIFWGHMKVCDFYMCETTCKVHSILTCFMAGSCLIISTQLLRKYICNTGPLEFCGFECFATFDMVDFLHNFANGTADAAIWGRAISSIVTCKDVSDFQVQKLVPLWLYVIQVL